VSFSGIVKCLFCAEILAFLRESRSLGLFTRCLLTIKLFFVVVVLLGHRLGDDLVDWNSGVSVRTSVRPSVRTYVHKKFFQFPSNLVCR